MRKLTWDMFLGCIVGAGLVYIAMLLINALTETFIWSKFFFEFFFFWDCIFAIILLVHWFLDKK